MAHICISHTHAWFDSTVSNNARHLVWSDLLIVKRTTFVHFWVFSHFPYSFPFSTKLLLPHFGNFPFHFGLFRTDATPLNLHWFCPFRKLWHCFSLLLIFFFIFITHPRLRSLTPYSSFRCVLGSPWKRWDSSGSCWRWSTLLLTSHYTSTLISQCPERCQHITIITHGFGERTFICTWLDRGRIVSPSRPDCLSFAAGLSLPSFFTISLCAPCATVRPR